MRGVLIILIFVGFVALIVRRVVLDKKTSKAYSDKETPEELAEAVIQQDSIYIWNLVADRLNDQKLIADIAVKVQDETVRQRATQKLTDTSALMRIAMENTDTSASIAVKKIDDQSILAQIAKKAQSISACCTAISKLKDQNLISEIARQSGDPDVVEAAMRQITDQAILQEWVLSGKNYTVCQAAWKKLTVEAAKELIEKQKDYTTLCHKYGHRWGSPKRYSVEGERDGESFFVEGYKKVCSLCGEEDFT